MSFVPRPRNGHSPPLYDELEVSLFGPGIGECVLVHLGAGEWMIVDSCLDRETRRPVALTYLEELGVDTAEVKLIVASHWHDDHCQGIADTLRAAQRAEFVCSAALTNQEFLNMVAGSRTAMMISSGVSEIRDILEILEERQQEPARAGSVSPMFAKSGFRAFWRSDGETGGAEVHALSPSDGALRLSWREIAQSIPELGQTKRRAIALRPNQIAVALSVRVGRAAALLGADLEESSSSTLGWRAVISSSVRPRDPASVFKVPHHGSRNAYSADVWSNMLTANPCAIVTPFVTGGTFLPTDADLRRLQVHTTDVYCTARPGGTRPPRRSGAVDGFANRLARSRRAIRGPTGHIRVRAKSSGSPLDIHCCRGAFRLE